MELFDDILTPAELTASARGVVDAIEENDITQLLLPNETSDDVRVEFEVQTAAGRRTHGTPLRSWDAEAAIGGGGGAEKRFAETVASSWKVRFSEYERLRRINETGTEAVSAAVDGRVREVVAVIVNRLRGLRSEALLTGQLAINEEGVVQTVDFGRRPDFTRVATDPWSSPDADPIADLEGWVADFADAPESGIEPTVAVIGRAAASAMVRNPNVVARFADGATVTLARVNEVLGEMGLPTLVVNRSRDVLSQRHVLLAVPGIDALGSTVWGPTAEALEEGYGLEGAERPGMAVGLYSTKDPIAWWVHGAAAYLPVLKNANLSFSAEVLAE